MNAPDQPSAGKADSYRFGAFEVRSRAGLLLRDGTRVRIQDLPLRLLLVLIEHPGEVVSRDQLRERLWGKRTFVEFDSGLRVAAGKLREALGDDAAQPRYLETVARRGYRFIAEVFPVPESVAGPASIRPTPASAAAAEPTDPSAPPPTTLPSAPGLSFTQSDTRRLLLACLAGALLLVMLVFGLQRLQRGHAALLRPQDVIALGSFVNRAQDPTLDEVLSTPFHVKMDESPYLRILSSERFARALPKPSGVTLKDELAACRQLQAHALLNGELTRTGQSYGIRVSAYNCADETPIAAVTERARSQDNLLAALDQACEKMRLRLGESREMLDRFNVPLVQATTSSLAALRAYRLGQLNHINGNETASKTYYKLAIDLDPQFALAYLQLGRTYSNSGEPALGRGYFQRAFELRERTTDRERLYIATTYYTYVTGETDRAAQAYQLWSTLYPQDVVPPNNLATLYLTIGRPRDAVGSARHAIELEPSIPAPYSVLAHALLKSGDIASLQRLCNDPVRRATASVDYHLACYEGAFTRGQATDMDREMAWARGTPQESALINAAAEIALYQGRLEESRRLFSVARQSALDNNLPEYATGIGLNEAALEAELGLTALARQDALDSYPHGPHGPEEEISAAIVWALLDEVDRANEAIAKANAQSPLGTLLNVAEIPEVRAVMALKHDRPEEALRELEPVRPYDVCETMDLTPGYYRGLAYLRAAQPEHAAAEFQHVVENRAAAPHSLYVLLAQLQWARLLSQSAQHEAALPHISALQNIWQGADGAFPPLRDLRALTVSVPVRR